MRRRWVLSLPLSALLHAVGLLALLWLVARAVDLPVLFVDLSVPDVGQGRSAVPTRDGRPSTRVGRRDAPTSPPATRGEGPIARGLAPSPRPASPPSGTGHAPGAEPVAAAPSPPDVASSPSPATVRDERRETDTQVIDATRSAAVRNSGADVRDPSDRGPISELGPPGAPRLGARSEPSTPGSIGTGDTGSQRSGPTVGAGGGQGARSGFGGSGRGAGGQALGTSSGTGGGAAEYGPYLAQWRRRIHENLRYPLAARRRSLTGTVQLDIVIQPNGAVVKVEVAESSSHGLLDDAAMEAVRGLPPLPFPSHLVPRPLRARLPVVFELQ